MPANRRGDVYGAFIGDGWAWLTVPGSHHHRPQLGTTPAQAEKHAPFAEVLALVEEGAGRRRGCCCPCWRSPAPAETDSTR